MTTTTSNNEAADKVWREFLYGKEFPLTCEGVKHGKKVQCKILADERVQFKIKRVVELTSKKGNCFYKVVCALRNYYSYSEPLGHPGTFYRMLAICHLSPASGRYVISNLRVDGVVVNRKENELNEYLFGFSEDAINDSIYAEETEFDGKASLIRLPGIFSGCKIAVPVKSVVKADFYGAKLFDISVDKSDKKYALKRLKDNKCGIGTDSQLIVFQLSELSSIMDADGIHTDRGHIIETLPLTKENLAEFKAKYC